MTRGASFVGAASTAAAALHFGAIGGHLRESAFEAALFFAAGLLQMVWAMAVGLGTGRPLLLAGVALNTGIAAVWLISRTTGLPFGAHAGEAEPLGAPDLLATAAEFVVVAGCIRIMAAGVVGLRFARG